MRRNLLLLAALGVLVWRSAARAAPDGALLEDALGAVDDAAYGLTGYRLMSSRWLDQSRRPENGALLVALQVAEVNNNIPPDLLVRLAWQESRFDPEAYNEKSGASGIMQIVPRWHPEVDPWAPASAIPYAARYLAQLYRQFGTWELALKAYNWGPGNVAAWLASGRSSPAEPLETQNYSGQILADLAEVGRAVA